MPPPLTPIDGLALSLTLVISSSTTLIVLVLCLTACCCMWLLKKRSLWRQRITREWGHPGQLFRNGEGKLEWRDAFGERIRRFGAPHDEVTTISVEEAMSKDASRPPTPTASVALGASGLARLTDPPPSSASQYRVTSTSRKSALHIDRRLSVAGSESERISRSSALSGVESGDRLSELSPGFVSFGVGIQPTASPARASAASASVRPGQCSGIEESEEQVEEEIELPKGGHPSRLIRAKTANKAQHKMGRVPGRALPPVHNDD